jgi:plastocyanin
MSTPSRHGTALMLGFSLLALLSPVRAAATGWSPATRLRVLMVDYRFVPSRLVLRRGTAYRLTFVNRNKTEWHEFTAPRFLKSVALGNPRALNAAHTELAVPPGGMRHLYLVPHAAGRYRFYCADHDWAGMVGTITVR